MSSSFSFFHPSALPSFTHPFFALSSSFLPSFLRYVFVLFSFLFFLSISLYHLFCLHYVFVLSFLRSMSCSFLLSFLRSFCLRYLPPFFLHSFAMSSSFFLFFFLSITLCCCCCCCCCCYAFVLPSFLHSFFAMSSSFFPFLSHSFFAMCSFFLPSFLHSFFLRLVFILPSFTLFSFFFFFSLCLRPSFLPSLILSVFDVSSSFILSFLRCEVPDFCCWCFLFLSPFSVSIASSLPSFLSSFLPSLLPPTTTFVRPLFVRVVVYFTFFSLSLSFFWLYFRCYCYCC